MIRVRRVAQRWWPGLVASAARAMLNAITASATQAALAGYFPEGRCARDPLRSHRRPKRSLGLATVPMTVRL